MVKLTADTSQLRNDLKLIDEELRNRGSGSTPTNSWGSQHSTSQRGRSYSDKDSPDKNNDTYSGIEHENGSKGNDSYQKIERAERTRLYREITLIRKELQRLNNSWGSGTSDGGSQQSSYTSPNQAQPNSQQLQLPGPVSQGSGSSPSSGTGAGQGGINANSLGSIIGKALSAGVILNGLNRARNYVVAGYERETSAEHQAYNTYGSNLNYTDYKQAKEQARDIGYQYGYDYSETMSANKAFMQSGGGWTDAGENMVNMKDIMGTAHATGADTQQLASAAGRAAGMGIDTAAFTSMFTNSVEMSGMTGREDEQLAVLENIADMLHETNVTVSKKDVADTMTLYNALVNNNENLKGSAGASMVNDINSAITGGGTSIYRALGYGTDIQPGMEGYLEVMRRASEGATPENLDRIFSYYTSMGITDESTLKYIIGNAFNMNNPQGIQKLDELFESMNYNGETGTWDKWVDKSVDTSESLLDEEAHKNYVGEREKNYYESDLAGEEQYQLDKQDTQENIGNALGDTFLQPLHRWFSNLSPGGKTAATVAGGALSVGGAAFGANLLGKGIGKLFGFGGGAAGSTAGAAGAAGEGAAAAGGSWFSNIMGRFTGGNAGGTGAATNIGNIGDFGQGISQGFGQTLHGKLWNWGKGFGEAWFPKGEAGSSFADILDDAGNVIGRTRVSDLGATGGEAAEAGASVIDDAARLIGGTANNADEAADIASGIAGAMNNADEAADIIGAVGNAANYSDEAADVLGAAGNVIGQYGDDVSRVAGIGSKIGKAAPIIGTGLQILSTGINVQQDDKRGDERAKSAHIGEGAGGVIGGLLGAAAGGAASGAIAGAIGGSVAPGIGNAIGLVGGAIVGAGVGIAGAAAGKEIGKAAYDATNEEQEFSPEQLKRIHEFYEKAQDIYDKNDDYNGKSGHNAAQDYVKKEVVPYLNSIGVSTSRTDEYNWDVGKLDFLEDVDKGIYGKSGKDWKSIDETFELPSAGSESVFDGTAEEPIQRTPENPFPELTRNTTTESVFPELANTNTAQEFNIQDMLSLNSANGVAAQDEETSEMGVESDILGVTSNMSEDLSEINKSLSETDFDSGSDKIIQELKDENNKMPNWLRGALSGLGLGGGGIGSTIGGMFGMASGGGLGGMIGSAIGGAVDGLLGGDNSSDGSVDLSGVNIEGSSAPPIDGEFADGDAGLSTHAQGLDYVPRDDYKALLHKGEMVLTHDEADDYRSNGIYANVGVNANNGGSIDLNINVNGNIQGMTAENQQLIVQAVIAQLSQSNLSNMLSNGFKRVQNM